MGGWVLEWWVSGGGGATPSLPAEALCNQAERDLCLVAQPPNTLKSPRPTPPTPTPPADVPTQWALRRHPASATSGCPTAVRRQCATWKGRRPSRSLPWLSPSQPRCRSEVDCCDRVLLTRRVRCLFARHGVQKWFRYKEGRG